MSGRENGSKGPEPAARRKIGFDLKKLEFGWPVGMPFCRSLGRGMRELRCSLPDGRIAQVILCVRRAELILLHGFIKKSQETPPQDIQLAWKRMNRMEG